jgi:DNA-binding NarL/FixJ family response regulator
MQRRIVIAARAGVVSHAVRRALAAAGFAVVADSEDAATLVATVARERPDLCVLDAALPGGGLVAAAAIASPGVPPDVIVLGGGGTPEARAAEIAGASAYLGHGEDDRLVDTVAALLRRRTNEGVHARRR